MPRGQAAWPLNHQTILAPHLIQCPTSCRLTPVRCGTSGMVAIPQSRLPMLRKQERQRNWPHAISHYNCLTQLLLDHNRATNNGLIAAVATGVSRLAECMKSIPRRYHGAVHARSWLLFHRNISN